MKSVIATSVMATVICYGFIATAQCHADTECKGDRICISGSCSDAVGAAGGTTRDHSDRPMRTNHLLGSRQLHCTRRHGPLRLSQRLHTGPVRHQLPDRSRSGSRSNRRCPGADSRSNHRRCSGSAPANPSELRKRRGLQGWADLRLRRMSGFGLPKPIADRHRRAFHRVVSRSGNYGFDRERDYPSLKHCRRN
jgi:hypothetical protein